MGQSTDRPWGRFAGSIAAGTAGVLALSGNSLASQGMQRAMRSDVVEEVPGEVGALSWSMRWLIESSGTPPTGSFQVPPRELPVRHWIIGSAASQSAVAAVRAILEEYAALPDGWDGPGSKAPPSESIQLAQELLDRIPSSVPVPKPMLDPSGDVGFYWNLEKAFADIVLERDQVISVFTRDKTTGEEVFVENLSAQDVSTGDLQSLLSRLAFRGA